MPATDDLILPHRRPTAERPLLGQTVLAVEDSRFACEALRLMCLRSGARIRRADSLRAAARHLATYRPSVAIVDLGLPDGSGLGLIRTLSRAEGRRPVILALSGDCDQREASLSDGADDFLSKPLTSLAAFQSAVLAHLPADERPRVPRPVDSDPVVPDPLAYRDDLSQIGDALTGQPSPEARRYAGQFLSGVALSAGDSDMRRAAEALMRDNDGDALAHVAALITDRLSDAALV